VVSEAVEPRAWAAVPAVVSVLRAPDPESLVSVPVRVLELDFGGVVGDRHHGLTQASDSRQQRYYPPGTLIRNRRQVTLVSVEELAEVADRLGVPEVAPEWLGANLLVEGVADLSALPIGTRLLFAGGAGLVCESVNQPCRLPAVVLQSEFPWSRAQARFVKAAYGRRGIAASVEHPAPVLPGEGFVLAGPERHAGRPLRSALGRAQRQAGDELLLQHEEHDDRRQRHQHRAR
jgi:MOSC domain-containing protein YiiM